MLLSLAIDSRDTNYYIDNFIISNDARFAGWLAGVSVRHVIINKDLLARHETIQASTERTFNRRLIHSMFIEVVELIDKLTR